MKDSYIRQIRNSVNIPEEKKAEIIRDIEEIFATAAEHGETEKELEARLGAPEAFAKGFEESPGEKRPAKWGGLIALTAVFGSLSLSSLAVLAVVLLRSTLIIGMEEGIIGAANSMTSIIVQGSGIAAVLPILMLGAVTAVFLALAVVFAVKLVRRCKRR